MSKAMEAIVNKVRFVYIFEKSSHLSNGGEGGLCAVRRNLPGRIHFFPVNIHRFESSSTGRPNPARALQQIDSLEN